MTRASPSPPQAVVAGLLVLVSVMGIGRFAYTPLLPRMQDAMGWSLAQAGDIASANFLGYLLGALASGKIAGRPSRAHWLVGALLASALTTLLGVYPWTYGAWLVLRLVAGAASAISMVIGTALVIDYVSQSGRPALSTAPFPGVGIGIVLSVLVIEATTRAGLSVAGQWGALGVSALVCTGIALPVFLRLPNLRPAVSIVGSGARGAGNPHHLRRLIAAYGLLGFGYVVTATFIVAMARQRGSAPFLEPLCWLVVGACAAPSVPLGRRLADRFGLNAVMRAAFVVEALGVLLAGLGHDSVSLLLGGACLGATFLSITALILNAARAAAGPSADAAMGWMTTAFGSGQWLGPFFAGRLAVWSGGFALPSLLAAGLLLLGAALLPADPARAD
jgi:predicted MFS family arabinose efflux permease